LLYENYSRVLPLNIIAFSGWWIGGRYSHLLRKKWGGIVDLTVEFPEYCKTQHYLCIPIWDGVPPTPDQLEQAALFAVNSKKDGDVLFHCAHGRGRSTTTMCAALVKSGMFTSWQEAFNAIKPGRPVVKLNTKMKNALTQWQQKYAKKH
jgi:protein-tyrosine phosphatase